MADAHENKPGDFCWVELMTSDTEGAKKFYENVMGWSFHDDQMPQGGTYTMVRVGQGNVAGMFRLNDEMKAQGIPPHWNSYVLVTSADATADKAATLGGAVLQPPFDVMEVGRMAVIQDPAGAAICLWQAKQHMGTQLPKGAPGTCGWNELATNDVEAATAFYTGLFDWKAEVAPVGGTDYTLLINGDTPAGGILQMNEEWKGMPPCWMVYFSVDDCDAAGGRAEQSGGTQMHDPVDIPGVGRFTFVRDPQGASCAIMKFAPKPK